MEKSQDFVIAQKFRNFNPVNPVLVSGLWASGNAPYVVSKFSGRPIITGEELKNREFHIKKNQKATSTNAEIAIYG